MCPQPRLVRLWLGETRLGGDSSCLKRRRTAAVQYPAWPRPAIQEEVEEVAQREAGYVACVSLRAADLGGGVHNQRHDVDRKRRRGLSREGLTLRMRWAGVQ